MKNEYISPEFDVIRMNFEKILGDPIANVSNPENSGSNFEEDDNF